ncbi:transmembrane protein 71 [Pleurodeles waltl]|uniref:transmembrane protein 71 n=1 Tax=Pleurodeles waltl TaxID=8319 RepID=UPI003709BC0C
MHGLPDLQSTPVSSKYSSVRSTPTVDLNTNIFEYSFLSDSDAGEWFRNCSFCGDSAISTLSRFDLTCRHSPRLLANGYYVLDEDSILSNEEGNLTLSPTKTNVTYKERLVRIFRRKKKKFCKSLASIFAMNLDNSVVDSSAISDMVTHDCDLDDKEDSDAENERNIDPDPQNSKSLLLETPAPFLTPSAVKEHVGPKVQEPPVLGKKTGRGASCPRIAERTGHSTSFEKEHRSDQRPEHLRRRVSYGGFLMVNGDNCEFSHGQGRWTSRNRRLVFNATRSPRHLAVLSPIKARLALSPKVHNAMPGYFCERNLRDFEINIARSPIYLIVMILVCIVISTWGI